MAWVAAGAEADSGVAAAADGRRYAGASVRLASRRSWRSAVSDWLDRERPQWFNWVPVSFGLGIAAYFWLPWEPAVLWAVAPLPFACLVWLLCRRGGLAAALAFSVAAMCLGFALAKLRTERVAAPVLERRIGTAEVRGVVELVEARATRGERLTIRVESISGLTPEATPFRVRVRTMREGAVAMGVAVATGAPAVHTLRAGDRIRVKAQLAPPAGPVLPGGYDFARGVYFQRLGGIGYALSRAELLAPGETGSLGIDGHIAQLRQAIGARIVAVLSGQTGAIANALITGERGGISEATNTAFRDSGLYHMLSISGLHMAIMGGAAFVAVRFLLALVPSIALRYPIKKWAAAAAILGTLGYLAISGGAFATVRSAVTIIVMLIAVLLDRPALAMRNVALSALLILLAWPESLNDVGFQMSFAAVVALVACYEAFRRWRTGRPPWWPERGAGLGATVGLFFVGILASTVIASVAVAPFGLYYFHKSQQLALIANLIATPLCNVVVMPAALAALVLMPFGLEAGPLAIMGLGVDLTVRCAEWVASLPGAVSRLAAIPFAAFAAMVAGGLWLALWQGRPRLLGLVAVAAGVAAVPFGERPDILIWRDGRLVAVRAADGRLAALPAPQATFDLARWLEHDGDARTPRELLAGAPAFPFRCDAAGCVASSKGALIAVPRDPAALADDCARADVLLLSVPAPRGCHGPAAVVDMFAVRARGAHALYLTPPTAQARPVVRVETVAAWRGARPWARLPWWAETGEARRRPARSAPAKPASGSGPPGDVAPAHVAPIDGGPGMMEPGKIGPGKIGPGKIGTGKIGTAGAEPSTWARSKSGSDRAIGQRAWTGTAPRNEPVGIARSRLAGFAAPASGALKWRNDPEHPSPADAADEGHTVEVPTDGAVPSFVAADFERYSVGSRPPAVSGQEPAAPDAAPLMAPVQDAPGIAAHGLTDDDW